MKSQPTSVESPTRPEAKVRAVTIIDRADLKCWAVAYVLRKKGQRYWAAQFDQSIKTRDQVQEWVRQQDHLVLLP